MNPIKLVFRILCILFSFAITAFGLLFIFATDTVDAISHIVLGLIIAICGLLLFLYTIVKILQEHFSREDVNDS